MTIKMIDLFSGAGLLSHAFEKNGFTPTLAIEMDKDAVSSYNRNANFACAKLASVVDVCDVDREWP
ncbi:DNA cytosine methyltransferase [Lentilitoribacter sp. Alg239-R112]|uniref:DNA cytosine methyltransferase n=1 Tax=Lentilitoribacter sp. Alg239-R112 TaxID=2305987 RepID=UPI0018D731E5|nr:DNA cytosine methyltransferase [Lentilitoribacter sp. Alg239-R112]